MRNIKDGVYYIGKVEDLCKISKKTLRYYDEIGLLRPDEIFNKNGYRHYSKDNLYTIPVIKYYKQSGFKLKNIKELIYTSNCDNIEEKFMEKIKELEDVEKKLNLKKKSIGDWCSLVKEAKMVINNNLCDVSVKFIEKSNMLFLDQEFNNDYMRSIINIEFTNYIEKIENAITGPVIIGFPSFDDKLQRKCRSMRIIQKFLLKCSPEKTIEFGGSLFVSCYHIGTHKNIDKTYEKIEKWMVLNNYKKEGPCYERYVLDYWTSKDEEKYVTEILVKIKN